MRSWEECGDDDVEDAVGGHGDQETDECPKHSAFSCFFIADRRAEGNLVAADHDVHEAEGSDEAENPLNEVADEARDAVGVDISGGKITDTVVDDCSRDCTWEGQKEPWSPLEEKLHGGYCARECCTGELAEGD